MANKRPLLNESSALLLQRSIESGITSPNELANLMGNAAVETANFSTMHERFNYRSAERVIATVASAAQRFTREQIDQAVESRDPQRVAEILYENRRDLGNDQPGDGWRFHGRGYFQYTGRANYTRWGRQFGVDLSGNPDQAAEPEMAARLAISYWKTKVPVEAREDVAAAAERINGGTNGMAARVSAAEQWRRIVSPQLVAEVLHGRAIYPTPTSRLEALRESAHQPENRDIPKLNEREHIAHVTAAVDTRTLQVTLFNLGYHGREGSPLIIDGTVGNNTTHAIKSLQRAHHLHVDGIVGKQTLAALEDAKRWPLLSEATHPQHRLYAQVEQGIDALPNAHGNAKELNNAAVALTIAAHASGLRQVDHVVLGANGVNLFAVQGRMDDPGHRRVHVELAHAMTHALDHRVMSTPAAGHAHAMDIAQQQMAQRGPMMMGP